MKLVSEIPNSLPQESISESKRRFDLEQITPDGSRLCWEVKEIGGCRRDIRTGVDGREQANRLINFVQRVIADFRKENVEFDFFPEIESNVLKGELKKSLVRKFWFSLSLASRETFDEYLRLTSAFESFKSADGIILVNENDGFAFFEKSKELFNEMFLFDRISQGVMRFTVQ